MGGKFLAFNVLLHTKSEQKVIGKLILCTNNNNNKSLKKQFFNKKYIFEFVSGVFGL